MAEVVNEVEIEGGVLAGHDGSAASAEALRWASRVARKLDEPLHVLRAWGMLNAPTPADQAGRLHPAAGRLGGGRTRRAGRPGARRSGWTAELELHVVHAQSSKALLHAAAGAELLVVARRGAGGFRGLGFGSTADQVARHAPCPVVIVPVGGARA